MWGQIYQKLRKKQNISQTEAAQDICSPAALSRWENDQIDLAFDKVVLLLQRINISLPEFINECELPTATKTIDAIQHAYLKQDLVKLQHLFSLAEKVYLETHSNYYLGTAAIAANYYFFLTDKNLLSEKMTVAYRQLFSKISYWSKNYIDLFAQTTFILNPEKVYRTAQCLLTELTTVEETSIKYRAIIIAVINSLARLVTSNLPLAQRLLSSFLKIDLPQSLTFMKMERKFLVFLLEYCESKNNTYVLQLISQYAELELTEEARTLITLYKKVEARIKH